MALIKGTNSYVSVTEATSYFENRIDVAAWEAASNTQKEQSLVTATRILETMDWTGVAVSDSQSLAFPRTGTYFDPRLGYDTTLSSVAATNRINNATFELAYHLLNNDGLLDETGDVDKLTVGKIDLTTIRRPSTLPATVKNLVRPLMVNAGSNTWWRAN
jgi:hypothetical protein